MKVAVQFLFIQGNLILGLSHISLGEKKGNLFSRSCVVDHSNAESYMILIFFENKYWQIKQQLYKLVQ